MDMKIIIDSSILGDVFFNKKSKKLDYFFKNNRNNIILPDFILSELHSNIFHKKIDFDNYNQWFKLRWSAYEKLLFFLSINNVEIIYMDLNSEMLKIFNIANAISSMDKKISLFIKENEGKLKYNYFKNASVFKFFNYTSSIMFSYVILYSLSNPDSEVVFLVRHHILKKLENYFIENKIKMVGLDNFIWPDNLKVKLLSDF